MPLLSIRTNQTLDSSQTEAFLALTSHQVAQMLGKPESYVMVDLETGCSMLFAGSSDPLAYLELKSIGLPADKTRAFSAELCDLIARELSLESSRIYIEFSDAPRALWGWNSTTF